MSYHIICESEGSWERIIVYHTQYENYIIFYSRRKIAKKAVRDQLNIASYQKCSCI